MKKPFAVAGFIYLVVSSVLLNWLQYYSDNPDTFQYISIAKKYLNLDWANAVNAYWSPLISWLLVVPLAVMPDSITAFKILQLAIGLFTIFQWCRLIEVSPLTTLLKYIMSIIAIPFIAGYALLNCTPDLLFVGMVMWLMNVLLSGNITSETQVAFKAAIIGSFMYFTKAFGLPLFIVLSISVIIFESRKSKINPRVVLLMYLSFALLCSVWISNISRLSGELTISKAASFNNNLSLEMLEGKEELPVLGDGIIVPRNGHNSAWEAPGDYTGNSKDRKLSDTVRRNALSIYYFDFSRQIGIIFLVLLFIYLYKNGKEFILNKWNFILLTTLILIYGGYLFILVHTRYIWVNTFIMLLMSVVFASQLIGNRFTRTGFYLLIILLALKRPLKEIFFIHDKNYPGSEMISAVIHPFQTLDESYLIDNEIQKTISKFHKIRLPKSNFASLKSRGFLRDTYTTSTRITESMDGVYYGEIKDRSENINQLLLTNKIDYLLAYEKVPELTQLFFDEASGIRVYGVKKAVD